LSRNIRLFQYTETQEEKLVLMVKQMMMVPNEQKRISIRMEATRNDSKVGQVLQGEDSLRTLITLVRFGGHFTTSKIFTVAWQRSQMQDVHGGVSPFPFEAFRAV
jgi:hypothetical protein